MNWQPEMDEPRRREALAETSIRIAPWLVFMPGIAILLAPLAVNLVGDDLRDALDPRQARQGASSP